MKTQHRNYELFNARSKDIKHLCKIIDYSFYLREMQNKRPSHGIKETDKLIEVTEDLIQSATAYTNIFNSTFELIMNPEIKNEKANEVAIDFDRLKAHMISSDFLSGTLGFDDAYIKEFMETKKKTYNAVKVMLSR